MEKILRFPKRFSADHARQSRLSEKITETISETDEQFTRIVKRRLHSDIDGFMLKWTLRPLLHRGSCKLVNRVGAGKLYEDNGILPVPRTQ